MDDAIPKKQKISLGWKITLLVALVIGTVLLYLRLSDYSESARLETVEDGNAIIAALDRYFSKNGKHPDSLELLVPDYIDRIERPKWGEVEWQYTKWGEDDFIIKIGYKNSTGGLYPMMKYNSLRKDLSWQSDM